MSAYNKFFIDRRLPKNKAFLGLRRASAIQILMLFFQKRVFNKTCRKKGQERYEIANNGELVFTYDEAVGLGINRHQFRNAITELIEKGFLDIARPGQGTHRVCTLYSLSDRWLKYGTSEFIKRERPKQKHCNFGFQPGNKLNPQLKKKNTSVESNTCNPISSVESNTCTLKTKNSQVLNLTLEKQAKIDLKPKSKKSYVKNEPKLLSSVESNTILHTTSTPGNSKRPGSLVEMPEILKVREFEQLWSKWKQHKKESGFALSPRIAQFQLDQLSQMGLKQAILTLSQTLKAGKIRQKGTDHNEKTQRNIRGRILTG